MARARLTDKFILAMKPPDVGRTEVFDTVKTGLCIRLTSNGAQSWSHMYRFNGEQRRETLGTYPNVSLAKARQLAENSLKLVGEGTDPRQVTAVAEAAETTMRANTVEAIVELFIAKHASKKRWGELERILRRDVVPEWNERPVEGIVRRDVRDLVEAISERAPVQANRTLTVLRIFFRWAAKNDYVTADPTTGIDKSEEKPRTRKLTDEEVRAFWIGCDRLGWPFGPLLQLLLLTAARKSEIAGAHWREIDTANCVLEIPGQRVKNKQPHVIPLSKPALSIIEGLSKIGENPDLVFTTNARTPVSGFSKAKAELDGYMLEELSRNADHPDNVKLEDWRIHDLRRVVRSNLSKLGVSSDVAERVLGHALSGIRRVYDAHEYLDEKRAALDRWAVHLEGIVTPQSDKVVKMRKPNR